MCVRNGVLNPVRHANELDSRPGSIAGDLPLNIEFRGRELNPNEAQQPLSSRRILSI